MLSDSWLPADSNSHWMLFLRGCMPENLTFSSYFTPAQVQIFWVVHLLQERKWPRKQKHKKSAVWKGEREQKKAEPLWKQGSQLRGMKGTGCRRLFEEKWSLDASPQPQMPLFHILLSLPFHCRDQEHVIWLRFLCPHSFIHWPTVPKLLKHLAPGEFVLFVYVLCAMIIPEYTQSRFSLHFPFL